jgi:probable HAF family extracellular repeat protein
METTVSDPACLNGGGCLASHGFLWNRGTLSDLGLLVSGDLANFSQSFSMNEDNNCAGISTFNATGDSDEPLFKAVLWKFRDQAAPELIDLGTLGGKQSLAHCINNRDQVVGWALNQTAATPNIWAGYPWPFGTQQRAILWENGTKQDLGTLGGPSAWAIEINDRGQIIGQSYTGVDDGVERRLGEEVWSRPIAGFVWENGNMVDLGNIGGTFMLPIRINNQGQVIGNMTVQGDSAFHPFLWTKGVLTDLGTFGGASGTPNAINELGHVVGRAEISPGVHRAFLWRDGEMKNLGTLGANSQAWAINAKTQVVGTSGRTLTVNRAFLWEDNREPMRDLNELVPEGSPHLAHAIGINDRGEILIGGLNEKGLYLLVPLPTISIRLSEDSPAQKILVEAQTLPGRTYRLETSPDLNGWNPVATSFVADRETTSWEFETGPNDLFYRITGPL